MLSTVLCIVVSLGLGGRSLRRSEDKYNTIRNIFIAKCQYDCTRNVLWCHVHSSHIHANHKTSNYNSSKHRRWGKNPLIK